MSGVRSSKTIEITVDGVLRNRRYDYITQNGKVVRETAYYTDGGEEFMHCLDFFYDENGHPFAMRKYTDETLSSYNTYYYILNAQGDVVKLIAPSGNVYAEYSYDAWGNILDSTGSLRNTNPLRYRGYYFDKETGFYYLQSRYYDPIVKRFLNADSYGSTGQGFLGYNMFAYSGNNPIRRSDPSGHSWITDIPKKIENLVKELINAAEKAAERKKRFQKSFEATYGVSFDSKCNGAHYSVSVDTHHPDKTAGQVSIATGGAGLALMALPDAPITKLVGGFLGVTSVTAGLIDYFSSDTEYQMYVVDIWSVTEWIPLSDGDMLGLVCGEKHMFRIFFDGSTGTEFLEYLGAVDFTHYTGVTPGERPCYQYYCNTRDKGIYYNP